MRFIFVVQAGRLEAEAAVLVESALRLGGLDAGALTAFAPAPGPGWRTDPSPGVPTRAFLEARGIRLRAVDNGAFGQRYPHANKLYALAAAGAGAVTFLDTDLVVLGPPGDLLRGCAFAVSRAAPLVPAGGVAPAEVWAALHRPFGVEPGATVVGVDGRETFEREPYWNAGVIAIADNGTFGPLYLETALAIARSGILEGLGQRPFPTLDQMALPVAMARCGGRVALLPPGVNSFGAGRAVRVWHYHTPHRLLCEGPGIFGAALEGVLATGDVRAALERHPAMAYWAGAEGRALWGRTRAAMPGAAPHQLAAALKEAGAPMR